MQIAVVSPLLTRSRAAAALHALESALRRDAAKAAVVKRGHEITLKHTCCGRLWQHAAVVSWRARAFVAQPF